MAEPPTKKAKWPTHDKKHALDRAGTVKMELEDSQPADGLDRAGSLDAETLHMSGSEPDLGNALELANMLEHAAQAPVPAASSPLPALAPPSESGALPAGASIGAVAATPNMIAQVSAPATPCITPPGTPLVNPLASLLPPGMTLQMVAGLLQALSAGLVHGPAQPAQPQVRSMTLASMGSTDSLVDAMLQAGAMPAATMQDPSDGSMPPTMPAGEPGTASHGAACEHVATPAPVPLEALAPAALAADLAPPATPEEPVPLATGAEPGGAAQATSHMDVATPTAPECPGSVAPVLPKEADEQATDHPPTCPAAAPDNAPMSVVAPGSMGPSCKASATKHGSDEESDGSDEEAPSGKAKRPPRARYMRFWRSIQAAADGVPKMKSTPKDVVEQALKVKGARGGLTALYEDFLQCNGQWSNNCLMHRNRKKHSERYRGRFSWLTKRQLLDRYHGDETVVADLCKRKARHCIWLC